MMRKAAVRVVVVMVAILAAGASLVCGQDTCFLLPTQTATVRYFPELGILSMAPVGTMVQSRYSRTTPENREFRRGFYEFHVPDYHDDFESARLVVPSHHAYTPTPIPPDTHEVSYYPADLVINTSDYDRPTTLLTLFETDINNEAGETLTHDIAPLTSAFACSDLGFRFKLVDDPELEFSGNAGSGFAMNANDSPSRIEVTLKEGNLPCLPELSAEPVVGGMEISWDLAYGAIGYDVAFGSLQQLHTHRGFGFSNSCLANDHPGTSVLLPSNLMPPPGDGYWLMIRTAHSCGCGSYADRVQSFRDRIRRDAITACGCS